MILWKKRRSVGERITRWNLLNIKANAHTGDNAVKIKRQNLNRVDNLSSKTKTLTLPQIPVSGKNVIVEMRVLWNIGIPKSNAPNVLSLKVVGIVIDTVDNKLSWNEVVGVIVCTEAGSAVAVSAGSTAHREGALIVILVLLVVLNVIDVLEDDLHMLTDGEHEKSLGNCKGSGEHDVVLEIERRATHLESLRESLRELEESLRAERES